MGKYLLQATYTQAGLVGLLKEGGISRRAALASTIEGAGGSLESLYYAFEAATSTSPPTSPTTQRQRPSH